MRLCFKLCKWIANPLDPYYFLVADGFEPQINSASEMVLITFFISERYDFLAVPLFFLLLY